VEPDGREHPVCPGCGFVYYLQPKLVAGALPVRDGRILLTRRAIEPARGLWTFPGGYVDWGEDVRAAAERETREEVALPIALEALHGIYSYPGSPVIVVYRGRVPPGAEPVPDPHEVLEAAYFGPEEIPWDALAFPSTRDALREWVRDGSPPAGPGPAARP
jgi:ADP-ribose pyrophosphatase YjhB (NUDIX family)